MNITVLFLFNSTHGSDIWTTFEVSSNTDKYSKKFQKKIIITYTDNGTKFNGEQSILQKRLQNVENRIETIKGTINFDANSESGFKISIKFPI